jgi:hypothetical protein
MATELSKLPSQNRNITSESTAGGILVDSQFEVLPADERLIQPPNIDFFLPGKAKN